MAEAERTDVLPIVMAATRRGLAPVTALLGLHYIPLGILHFLNIPAPEALPTSILNQATAVGFLIAAARWWRDPPSDRVVRTAPPIIAGLVLLNVAVHYSLAATTEFNKMFAFVIIGASVLLLETRSLATMLAATVVTWAITTFLFVPDVDWTFDVPAIIGFCILAGMVHYARQLVLHKMEELRQVAELRRNRAEKSLSKAEDAHRLLRQIVEHNPDGVFVLREGTIVYANQTFRELMRTDEVEGTRLSEIVRDDEHRLGRWFTSDVEGTVDTIFVRGDDTEIVLALSIPRSIDWFGPAVMVSCRDVTGHHADIKARMMQTDRLVAVGTLAAGVAHEINNPLSWVITNARIASKELESITALPVEQRRAMEEALRDVKDGAERIKAVVADLGGLARPNDDEEIDLHDIIRSTMRLAGNRVRMRARVKRELREVPLIVGSKARLGQVLLNLVLNAVDAVEAVKDPVITLATRTDTAGNAVLEVRDNGVGMDADTAMRAFDPFFTTKEPGKGTGLGLSICFDVVTRMGGDISVTSEPGKGTRFQVVLPVAAVETDVRTVLIIDDEPNVGSSLQRLLKGHTVVVETSPRAALDRDLRSYDLVLCDVMMPELDGIALRAEVAKKWPGEENRIVFMTGGTFDPALRKRLEALPNEVWPKPLDPVAVEERVANLPRRGPLSFSSEIQSEQPA